MKKSKKEKKARKARIREAEDIFALALSIMVVETIFIVCEVWSEESKKRRLKKREAKEWEI